MVDGWKCTDIPQAARYRSDGPGAVLLSWPRWSHHLRGFQADPASEIGLQTPCIIVDASLHPLEASGVAAAPDPGTVRRPGTRDGRFQR
jgi:hypothetical protein